MGILRNRFIFLLPKLPTAHKPKIMMIHEEMHHVLQKTDIAKNAQFRLLICRILP